LRLNNFQLFVLYQIIQDLQCVKLELYMIIEYYSLKLVYL
jgi:hypothetical protein